MLARGEHIPNVPLVKADGATVLLGSLIDRPMVLFFYPKDNTPGCTVEVCAFRDDYLAFVEAGADVIGVSSDDTRSHAKFRERHNLPYRLMSDPDGEARKAFGVPKTLGILPGRATFVIDRQGTIVYAFNSQFAPEKHVKIALEALRVPT
jgi:peroxiredoxin Q/BCP